MSGATAAAPAPSRRRFRSELLLVALSVVAITGTSYAMSTDPAGSADQAVLAVPSEAPAPVTSLWFGDGYAAECCRSDTELPSMAEVAAARWGWAEPQVVGERGTGYLSRQDEDQGGAGTYTERIEAAVEGASYDVVVLFGGDDDEGPFDAGRFRAAVAAVLAEVRESLPRAQLVVLAPTDADEPSNGERRGLLQAEAASVGAAWIDPVASAWTTQRPQWLAEDDYHLNDAGHAFVGGLVADAFRRTLPERLTTGLERAD